MFMGYRISSVYSSHNNYMRHMHMHANNSDDNHWASLGQFMLYTSFPLLAAELRGCVYYCQHVTVLAVLLVHILSSHH